MYVYIHACLAKLIFFKQNVHNQHNIHVTPVFGFFPLRYFCSYVVVVALASGTNMLWPIATDMFC